jgi:hypothetical protein
MAWSSLLTVCSSLRLNLANWVELWLETFVHNTGYKERAVFPITYFIFGCIPLPSLMLLSIKSRGAKWKLLACAFHPIGPSYTHFLSICLILEKIRAFRVLDAVFWSVKPPYSYLALNACSKLCESWYIYDCTWAHRSCLFYKSLSTFRLSVRLSLSVCLCILISFLGNNSAEIFPVAIQICLELFLLCEQCRMKVKLGEKKKVVFPLEYLWPELYIWVVICCGSLSL